MHTTTSLECTLHETQGFDGLPTLEQAYSLFSPDALRGGSKRVSIEANSTVTAHGSATVASNQNDILPSNEISDTEISPVINEAGNDPDVATAAAESSLASTNFKQIFRFQDLASEIRNCIYHYVLGPPQDPSICLTQILDDRPVGQPHRDAEINKKFHTKSVEINPEHYNPEWRVMHEAKPQDLSILLVSKQIYAEAFHIFYATNCLFFTDTGLLYRFLKNIGYIRRQHLTMIYFLWRGPDAKETFRLLKTCRRLKSLQFTVPCSHPPGYEALKEVRVQKAQARALIHFASAQNPPLNIHDHTSCFGDYQCHCLCRRPYEPASSMQELESAMMRPRRLQDLPNPNEVFSLFNPRREHFKRSEEQELLREKTSFDNFISKIEQQGKELKHLGRRNKAMEATLNHTLTGSDVEDYFRDFNDKLAEDKRLLKRQERWDAKQQWEKWSKEMKAFRERLAREKALAKELKRLHDNKMRREARELRSMGLCKYREDVKREAREARELKRRNVREKKEREKMMRELKRRNDREEKEREKMIVRKAREKKKADRDAQGNGKKVDEGTDEVVKRLADASD